MAQKICGFEGCGKSMEKGFAISDGETQREIIICADCLRELEREDGN